MLRIIHTGRAYEVLDSDGYPGLLEAMNEVGYLNACLFALQLKLKATELKLKSCQKSTLESRESQNPH